MYRVGFVKRDKTHHVWPPPLTEYREAAGLCQNWVLEKPDGVTRRHHPAHEEPAYYCQVPSQLLSNPSPGVSVAPVAPGPFP